MGVHVVKRETNGEMVSSASFSGRLTSLMAGPDGKTFLPHDEGTTAAQAVWLRRLRPQLKAVWKTPLLEVPQGLARFKVAVNDGKYVVAGLREFRPWLVTVN